MLRHRFISICNCSQRFYSSKANNAKIKVNEYFINRNPRNLEIMGIGRKPEGWELQAPLKLFWHKCIFVKTSIHTSASIVHNSGATVVDASTKEPIVSKYLYSNVDVSAAANIGRLLALRCLHAGLEEVFFDSKETPISGERLLAFFTAMEENGVHLQEKESIISPEQFGIDYDGLTEAEKRALYPSLIEELRLSPDWGSQATYPYSLRPRDGYRTQYNVYQSLSKIRQGMWWDRFYKKLTYPEKRPHWMPDLPKPKEPSES